MTHEERLNAYERLGNDAMAAADKNDAVELKSILDEMTRLHKEGCAESSKELANIPRICVRF